MVSGPARLSSPDDRPVSVWFHGHCLLDESEEQLAPAARLPTVEPERKLIQVVIQMFETDGAQVRWMAGYSFEVLSWPRSDCRYLMGLFNGGWPRERDYLAARRWRVPLIKIWACDHLCLFGRGVPVPRENRLSRR